MIISGCSSSIAQCGNHRLAEYLGLPAKLCFNGCKSVAAPTMGLDTDSRSVIASNDGWLSDANLLE